MIRTKDLIEFMESDIFGDDSTMKYIHEVVARLQAYDKLIKGIEKLIKQAHKDN
ncbi:MAG: hypothetical protein V3V81_08240 [Candidatus Bathyarchaeia archaeon]